MVSPHRGGDAQRAEGVCIMTLQGKKIVLGITGSIAAYKAAVLIRLLIKKGAEVQVVITPAGINIFNSVGTIIGS